MTISHLPPNDKILKALFVLLCLALIWLCVSCSHTKDLTKTKTEEKTVTTTETATTRTITETAKDSVTVKADSLTSDITLSRLLDGDSIEVEKNGLTISVKLDKNKKVIAKAKVSEKIIPVNINKVTVENVKENKHEVKKTVETVKDLHKKVTGGFNFNWLWLILLAILIVCWRMGLFNKSKRNNQRQ